MQHDDEFLITDYMVNGFFRPQLFIKGEKKQGKKIKIIIDGKEYSYENYYELNKDYVYNRILKHHQDAFNIFVYLPKYSKKIEIFYDNKLCFVIKTSFLKRFINSFKLKFLNKIVRFPKIIIKTVKLMWKRHHLLVPPKMIKQYFSSFRNNIDNKNIDEILYNPLLITDYNNWLVENKENINYKKFEYNPLISIIIPTYNVSGNLLSECLDSILNQSYRNFEICIADDNSSNKETINTLKKYENNKKVKITYRDKNGHISNASNTALELANGEFVGLVDNDDILDKDALYYVVEKLNQSSDIDLLYSDEDKINLKGEYCYPFFKPDYSKDTLLSTNYFCHFTVIRKKLIEKINGFRSEYDGAQDYDLFLRIIDLTDSIAHIPQILYHWRMIEGSTSVNGDNKNYAYIAGKKALEDYIKRNKINASVELINNPAMYQIQYKLKSEPKISIIIPTKDKSQVLKKCIDSIYSKTAYKNFEVIVIDNNSNEVDLQNLLDYYKDHYDNFNYYRLECEFNYSYINNYAVSKSAGDYIVLLNNDTEVISKNWLTEMVGYASQKHIGCVGVKLLYPNGTIQHCGVVTGVGGVAMHANVQTGKDNPGYFGRLISVYNWSCVTAACLMVSRGKFLSVDGLDENLKVAYNDVDFCLKMIDKNLYNVVLPSVSLYHYESLSRGDDFSQSQIKRFKKEIDYMCDKWGMKIINDKFYNKNLSDIYAFRLEKSDKYV